MATTTTAALSVPQFTARMLDRDFPDARRVHCRAKNEVPKLEPFTQSRTSRWLKQRSLLEKAEQAIQDHCIVLDGDEAYKCYEALFEFEDIKHACEKESTPSTTCKPLQRLEKLVRQSTGVSNLIDNLRMLAAIGKQKKTSEELEQQASSEPSPPEAAAAPQASQATQEPFSLPKTQQELDEDQNSLLPESWFTRLLRRRSLDSKWFATGDV